MAKPKEIEAVEGLSDFCWQFRDFYRHMASSVGHAGVAVYAALSSFGPDDGDGTRTMNPSLDSIGKRAGIKSRATVMRALRRLEEVGALEVVTHGTGVGIPNIYQLADLRSLCSNSKHPLFNSDQGGVQKLNTKKRELERKGAKRKKPKRSRPEDFTPTANHETIANQLSLDLKHEFARFCDHHDAVGSQFVDWNAALRNWLRRAPEFSSPRQKKSEPSRSDTLPVLRPIAKSSE